MKRTLGTCFYPEHWPENLWKTDAKRMAELGLTWVRIGEFAWSKLEPTSGDLRFEWLDRAIDILGQAGLQVVLGTPTATPPRWMVDKHPDMLAVDANGNPRKFGSRRHYCFSHQGYRQECARIVTLLAERYGSNPYVAAWQTDNEYGCHDTTVSYSDATRQAFRGWLRSKYQGQGNDGNIDALNAAWGNVFWSMDYSSFDQIDLPNLTVTEPNPAHVLDFRRFSSDQVVSFNKLQVDIIRSYSNAPIAHNYMGGVTDFDHFKLGNDLDIASWDSYPIGFLEDRVQTSDDRRLTYMRQGDPDYQAFHHDLYRAVGKGRWWIMEQQPGPVNWAPYNPAPLPGMVRLWTWEAFAHGAEAVCYFRWRQAPMAQEQMHAGILRPDSAPAEAYDEAAEVARELADASEVAQCQSNIALVFDYDADWSWAIQPHAKGLTYLNVVFEAYRALRKLGLSIDIVPSTCRDFTGYRVIAVPGLMHLPEELSQALSASSAQIIYGPRTAAREANFNIPNPLPPAIEGLNATVSRVESLRPDAAIPLQGGGLLHSYREHLISEASVDLRDENGTPVSLRQDNIRYLGAVLDVAGWIRIFQSACATAQIETMVLPQGIRTRTTASERFWFNHLSVDIHFNGTTIPAAGVLREPLA